MPGQPKPAPDEWDVGDHSFDAGLDLPPDEQVPVEQPKASDETKSEPPPPGPSGGQTPPAASSISHPRSLVLKARRLGFTEDEIQAYSTRDLSVEVASVERELEYASRDRTPPPPPAPSQPAAKPEPPPEDDIDLGLDESQWEPEIIKALKAPHRKVKELEKQLAEVRAREQARESAAVQSKLDSLFGQHAGIYGKSGAIDAASPEAMRRTAVYQQLHHLVQSGKQTTLDKDFASVHAALFGSSVASTPPQPESEEGALTAGYGSEPVAKPARPRHPESGRFLTDAEIDALKAEAAEKARWDAGALAKPTQRAGSTEPKGVNRAVRAVAQLQRQNGTYNPDDYDGSEESNLPD